MDMDVDVDENVDCECECWCYLTQCQNCQSLKSRNNNTFMAMRNTPKILWWK